MEVTDIEDFKDAGEFQIRKITVRLSRNMMSLTIEKLLSQRKKQVQELSRIVQKDIVQHDDAHDIQERVKNLDALHASIEREDSHNFNDNARLKEVVSSVMDLMPKVGDEIACMSDHRRDVFGLVATDLAAGFASSSFDGTARVWSLNDRQEYKSADPTVLPGPSLTLASVGGGRLASGQFDGKIVLQAC